VIVATVVSQFWSLQCVQANSCAQNFAQEKIKETVIEESWRDSGGSLFRSLRGNARHYWAWVRSLPSELIPLQLWAEGIIVGDPHLRNFSDVLINGKRKFRVIDFDDNGHGPFLFDFAKFVSTARSQRLGLTTHDLFDKYQKGLNEEKQSKPDFLEEALDISEKSEKKQHKKFLKRMTDGNTLVIGKKKDLIPIEDSPPDIIEMYREAGPHFEIALKDFEILDKAVNLKKTGGELRPRFWYLVENKNGKGKKQIFEFKQVGEPAISALSQQASFIDRFEAAQDIYWEGERDPKYRAISVGKQNYFMRPGFKGTFDLTNLTTENHKEKARKMLLYIAYHMGRMVARQDSASGFIDALNENPHKGREIINTLANEYLQFAREQ